MRKLVNWFVGKASVRKKLGISYLILVLIPILILGIYSFVTANNNLLRQTEETMVNNLERIVSDMDSRFERETDFTKYLAYNLEFRSSLEDNAFNGSELAQSLNKTVEPVLWYFIASDKNIKTIQIVTPNTLDDIGSFLKSAQGVEEEDWYQQHKTDFNTIWTVENGKLYATRTILDTDTSSRMIGILRTEFYLEHILSPVESMNYLDNGILVLDRDNQVVYEKEISDVGLQEQIRQDISDPSSSGQGYLLKTAHIDYADWDVYYFIDKGMITRQTRSILTSTLLMIALCTVLIAVVVGIMTRTISRRILMLKEDIEEIGRGNLDNPVFTEDTDEIGIVTNGIGKMTVRLNEMINRVYKIELEKKASQLAALQAQINPHFLYNCLSTIKWKALKKGDEEIGDIAGLVARFYRTALNNGRQFTTVSDELDNIRAYVEIQKKMHDDGFSVEYRIDEEGLGYTMPNFLLQPVVENAIEHGIDYVEEGTRGKIMIEFVHENGCLLFSIYNNGPLIAVEDIDTLLHTQGHGYGLNNIEERIHLYYGEDYGISVRTTEERYTCFTIRIGDSVECEISPE